MPVAKIQAPDGRIFTVEVPQGATPEQIMAFVEQNYQSTPSVAPQQQPVAQVAQPAKMGQSFLPDFSNLQGKSRLEGILEQGGQGAGFGFTDEIGSGLAALALGARGALGEPRTKGIPLGDLYSQIQGLNQQRINQQQTDMPITSGLAQLGGGVASALATGGAIGANTPAGVALQGMNPIARGGVQLGLAGLGAAATGSLTAAGMAEQGQKGQAALNTSNPSALLGAGLKGAGMVAGSLVPRASVAGKKVLESAKRLGVDLSVDQVSDNAAIKYGKSLANLVSKGGAEFEEKQRKQITKKALSLFGATGDEVNVQNIEVGLENIGKQYDSALRGKTIKFQPDDIDPFIDYADEVLSTTDEITARPIMREIENFVNSIDKNEEISGEKIGSLITRLTNISRKSTNPAIKQGAGGLLSRVFNVVDNRLPESSAVLRKARSEYANYKVLEPLMGKAIIDGADTINPIAIANAVKTGRGVASATRGRISSDLLDLARVGQVMRPAPSSGTTERALIGAGITGAISGGASALGGNPEDAWKNAAIGVLGYGIAPRAFNALNTNSALMRLATQPQRFSVGATPFIAGNIVGQQQQ